MTELIKHQPLKWQRFTARNTHITSKAAFNFEQDVMISESKSDPTIRAKYISRVRSILHPWRGEIGKYRTRILTLILTNGTMGSMSLASKQ